MLALDRELEQVDRRMAKEVGMRQEAERKQRANPAILVSLATVLLATGGCGRSSDTPTTSVGPAARAEMATRTPPTRPDSRTPPRVVLSAPVDGGEEASEAVAVQSFVRVSNAPPTPQPVQTGNEPNIDLRVVKYAELGAEVKARRGKVVVVDTWATYCVPCMREFPHLVRLHETYAKEGLECISVSVDKLDRKERALEFLKSRKARFSNFLLDEPGEVWTVKFAAQGIPLVFVFDRAGKLVRKFDNDDDDKPPFSYDEVEDLVKRLLSAKVPR
jgi:thiol-disulfide isomerase/thioredoxin